MASLVFRQHVETNVNAMGCQVRLCLSLLNYCLQHTSRCQSGNHKVAGVQTVVDQVAGVRVMESSDGNSGGGPSGGNSGAC